MPSRRRLHLAILAIAAVAVAVFLLWPDRPAPDPMALAAEGRAVYMQHCASCHGAGLEGQPNWQQRKPDGKMPAPPHDATGHTWHHPDSVLTTIVREGTEAVAPPGYRSDMPGFGSVLSEREIQAVLAFIKSTWPDEIRERQAEISRRAASR